MRRRINEFVDELGNIITGDENKGMGKISAMKTTDYNSMVGNQRLSPNFLGRFGFYFFENDEKNDSEVNKFLHIVNAVKDDIVEYFQRNKINRLIEGLNSYYKNLEISLSDALNESIIKEKMESDLFLDKSDGEITKIKKIVDDLQSLSKKDLDIMLKIIEERIYE